MYEYDPMFMIPVAVSAGLHLLIGMVWYSAAAFGPRWRKLTGQKSLKSQDTEAASYLSSLIGALVMAFVLGSFIHQLDITAAGTGAYTGFMMWLGFVVTIMGGTYVMHERSLELFMIDAGFYLVSLITMGAVIAAW